MPRLKHYIHPCFRKKILSNWHLLNNTDTIEQLDREEENHILTKNKLELEMVNIDAIKAELDIERSKVRVSSL